MTESKSPHDLNHLPDNLNDCHSLIWKLFFRIAELEKQLSRQDWAASGRKSANVDASLLTGAGKGIHNQTTMELSAGNCCPQLFGKLAG